MKQSICLFFIFFASFTINAQNAIATSARSTAMGGTGLTFNDINSAFSNQAGLAQLTELGVILSAESRFIQSPINNFGAATALPSKFGVFGLALSHYGIQDFNEQKIGLTYARKLTKGLSLGAQFDFINVNIPTYGAKGALTFEIGLQAAISKEIQLGVHVFSPINVEVIDDYAIPTIYRAGIAYIPSSKTQLTLEIEKDIDFPTRVRTGVEYRFIEDFYMRVGAATAPTIVTFGIGVQVPSGLGIDISSSYHQILGITPSVAIIYTPKKID